MVLLARQGQLRLHGARSDGNRGLYELQSLGGHAARPYDLGEGEMGVWPPAVEVKRLAVGGFGLLTLVV